MSGSVSCGRYWVGVTYSRPLLRPWWCTRTIGAPSKIPPTLPSLARNSVMVFAFQSLIWENPPFRLDGDALCAGKICREALSGSVKGRGPFVEHRVIGPEELGHPGGAAEV